MIKITLEIKETDEGIAFVRTPSIESPTDQEIGFAQMIVTLLEMSSLISEPIRSIKAENPSNELIHSIRKRSGLESEL